MSGFVYLLFYSPIFKVKTIVVDSQNSQIKNAFNKYYGTNILLLSSQKIENEIAETYPEVKGLKITRGLPDTLKIGFEARTTKIIWQSQEKKYFVDSSGAIYKEVENTSDPSDLMVVKDNNDLLVKLGQQVVSEKLLDFLSGLNSTFNEATGFKIDHFEVNETLFQIDAFTDQRFKVIFDTTRKSEDQLSDLKKFLADHKDEAKEYIDMRVEGRIYYK